MAWFKRKTASSDKTVSVSSPTVGSKSGVTAAVAKREPTRVRRMAKASQAEQPAKRQKVMLPPGGQSLLIKPVVTEKASSLSTTTQQKLCFLVAAKSNKATVKQVVEALYAVKVVAVHIIQAPGRPVRFRGHQAYRQGYKKAIVTLAAGEKVEIYTGV